MMDRKRKLVAGSWRLVRERSLTTAWALFFHPVLFVCRCLSTGQDSDFMVLPA